jgi:hypothetical protein
LHLEALNLEALNLEASRREALRLVAWAFRGHLGAWRLLAALHRMAVAGRREVADRMAVAGRMEAGLRGAFQA